MNTLWKTQDKVSQKGFLAPHIKASLGETLIPTFPQISILK